MADAEGDAALTHLPHALDLAAVRPRSPWQRVEYAVSVGSTNAVLLRDPRAWRVLVAEEQRDGRGRLGRGWTTVPRTSLAVSVTLPAPERGEIGWVPLLAGLALCDALVETAGLQAALKWPNDVIVPADGERKLAGILSQWVPPGGVVVGAGVNVTTSRSDLPVDTATSVTAAGGQVTREALLTAYLDALARRHDELSHHPDRMKDTYRAACATIGREVRVHEPAGQRVGRVLGVDDEGRLLLRASAGDVALSAGDVVHVRPAQPT